MIKFLLTTGAVGFLCASFLDPLWASGLDRSIPWIRDSVMAGIGAGCFYLLVKFRKEL
ncbi:MAG: hypothetical protein PHD01_02140 [Geobacteraceae bacterium]|nr:hypothetical protein [Geobacteraceae bacterium]